MDKPKIKAKAGLNSERLEAFTNFFFMSSPTKMAS
jgi:hypothetical protein